MKLKVGKLYLINDGYTCKNCIVKYINLKENIVIKKGKLICRSGICCVFAFSHPTHIITEYIPIHEYLDKLRKKYVKK